MKTLKSDSRKSTTADNGNYRDSNSENGSAIVIALLIMVLLLGFVAFAITRTNNETVSASNDASETRAFEAAHASLEVMTRNFDKIFDSQINATPADLARVQGQIPPDFGSFQFAQSITQTQPNQQVVMTGQQYQGLFASRDEWLLDSSARENSSGVEVQLRRSFYNNRIPIFQFGIFYDDDLEFHPGPRFDFGGRVHSNGSLFLKTGNELRFSDKVSSSRDIYTDVMRNGSASTTNGVKIKNASGTFIDLNFNMGSVLRAPVNGVPVSIDPDMPITYANANWSTIEKSFQGNLASRQRSLELPIRLESNINDSAVDYSELVKRGKEIGSLWNNKTAGTPTAPNIVPVTSATKDTDITSRQRYYNGTGIRVSLADSKAKLPGCASGVGTAPIAGPCGIRLDGDITGNGTNPAAGAQRGYRPQAMIGGYQATGINGERIFVNGKESWIKVETVAFDTVNNVTVTTDITRDFLSLGVTEPAPQLVGLFQITNPANYYTSGADTRSIIKLQRFAMISPSGTRLTDNNFLSSATFGGVDYTYIVPAEGATNVTTDSTPVDNGAFANFVGYALAGPARQFGDHTGHWREAVVVNPALKRWIVPFPIKMFDAREGTVCNGCPNPDTTAFNPNDTRSANKDGYGPAVSSNPVNVPWMGVMSMVDIDIANLRKLLRGDFDAYFPNGLTGASIPSKGGWILHVSDRRGDFDFDGEFDMEDIYGKNDCINHKGEDVNFNGLLDTGGLCVGTTLNLATSTEEAPAYFAGGLAPLNSNPWKSSYVQQQIAAVLEHKFYRRGVRLINGVRPPGKYDSAVPANTQGFTVASENGVYVQGNYNTTGIKVGSTGVPTPSEDYEPINTVDHIPASIAADAVTILSNSWSDAVSFSRPFNSGARVPTETYVRFAMLAGDAKSSLAISGQPSQSTSEPRLGGGVHNFKRFLENWGGIRLNYTGSLINLFNSQNASGTYKTGFVYGAPTRNWIFDSTFRDPNRLPPGTPYFQFLQFTGFQRVN